MEESIQNDVLLSSESCTMVKISCGSIQLNSLGVIVALFLVWCGVIVHLCAFVMRLVLTSGFSGVCVISGVRYMIVWWVSDVVPGM